MTRGPSLTLRRLLGDFVLQTSTTNDDLRARLDALDIDVGCALAFGRATLQALAAMSAEARHAIDRSLAEEAAIVRVEDVNASHAIAAMLTEARQAIVAPPNEVAEAVREIERLLVEQAAKLPRVSELTAFSRKASACG
jgi:hypothetical protein